MSVQTRSDIDRSQDPAAAGVLNGFEVATLGGLVETLEEHPEGGRATLFIRTRWRDGDVRVVSRMSGYEIDGERVHETEREHVVRTDELREVGSTDTAASPGELFLSAVGSCITATTRAYAATRGIRLSSLEVAVDGDVKLQGMFGLDANVRPGLRELRVTMRIAGDADDEALRELALLGYQFSPVRETVHNGAPVTPDVVVSA
ncbi:MAG: OsmC family protein [Gemmatimonadota bacterium]